MFNGYTVNHPTTGSGLAKWQHDPAAATTPSAQDLASGATAAPTPEVTGRAGTGGTVARPQPATPPPQTIAQRAAGLAAGRATPGAETQAQPSPLAPPPAAAPPPTSLAPPPPVPALTSLTVDQGGGYGVPAGFEALGSGPGARAPLNIGGTALTGAQLAALAGSGRPGDPFTGGYAPLGGWNPSNGGTPPADQAAAIAAYKAQYGDPNVTLDQVLSQTSNDPSQLEAARRLQQQYQDDVGRFS